MSTALHTHNVYPGQNSEWNARSALREKRGEETVGPGDMRTRRLGPLRTQLWQRDDKWQLREQGAKEIGWVP